MKYNFSIAAIFKNETKYLDEWLEYHRIIGCEHFYLVNNSIEKDLEESTQLLIKQNNRNNDITWYNYQSDTPQMDSCKALVEQTRGQSKWVGFIDIDEFIFMPKFDNINKILERYPEKEIAALAVHWCIFGSSGKKQFSGLVVENFFQRARLQYHRHYIMKLILQPEKTITSGGSHWAIYKPGYYAVDELKRPMPDGTKAHKAWHVKRTTLKSIRINHYCVKSEQAYKEKVARGFVDKRVHEIPPEKWKAYFQEMDRNEVRDDTMKRFIPEIKKRMLTCKD